MKKFVGEFVAKDNLDKVLAPNWRDLYNIEKIKELFNSLEGLFSENKWGEIVDFLIARNPKGIKENELSQMDSFTVNSISISLSIIFKDREDWLEKFKPYTDVYDPQTGEFVGVAFSNLTKDVSMMDDDVFFDLTNKEWSTKLKIDYLDYPIYPASGMVVTEDNPHWKVFEEINKRDGLDSKEIKPNTMLFYYSLSEIYHHFFPNKNSSNTEEYYKNLRSLEIFPCLEENFNSTEYGLLAMFGALKPGVTRRDLGLYCRNVYLEF